MNLIVKAGCRIFQKAFRLVIPVLPYREPKIVDACDDLKEVFEKKKNYIFADCNRPGNY